MCSRFSLKYSTKAHSILHFLFFMKIFSHLSGVLYLCLGSCFSFNDSHACQVTADSDPWIYALLSAVKQETGWGVLINTSFNTKVIAHALSQYFCVGFLANSLVMVLCYLLKKNIVGSFQHNVCREKWPTGALLKSRSTFLFTHFFHIGARIGSANKHRGSPF